MRTTCIAHPAHEPIAIIRNWQIQACRGNHCAAALLSFFEYWHNIKLNQQTQAVKANKVAEAHGVTGLQDVTLVQFHSEAELETGLLGLYKRKTIGLALKFLVAEGYLSLHSNPNPRYYFDRTRYFLFHPGKCQEFIANLDQVKKDDARRQKGAPSSFLASPPHKKASPIPESSSEISSDIPSVFTIVKTSPPREKKHQRLRTDYTPGFLAWWTLYPPDRRTSKPECFLVWLAHSLEARTQELCEKLQRLLDTTWKDCERRYIKTSLPYLNSGRYEDDLVPFSEIPTQRASGLSEKGYRTAMAAQKIMEDMQHDDAQRSTTLLSSPDSHGRDISG